MRVEIIRCDQCETEDCVGHGWVEVELSLKKVFQPEIDVTDFDDKDHEQLDKEMKETARLGVSRVVHLCSTTCLTKWMFPQLSHLEVNTKPFQPDI